MKGPDVKRCTEVRQRAKPEAVRLVVAHLEMLRDEGSLSPKVAEALPLFLEWMRDADMNVRVLRRIAQVMEEEAGTT